MNIFVSTTFLSDGKTLHEALSQCQQEGIQSVEIGSNHCHEKDYAYSDEFSFQYLVHNYFPIPRESFVLNIASFNENIRSRSIQHVKTAINFCNDIGGRLYTLHPGFMTDPHGSNSSNQNYDFQWDENQLQSTNYDQSKDKMYFALDEIIKYASSKNVSIAIETEGSLNKKDHLLMQRPDEYEEFMMKYNPSDIGINLNIGHLNLAANAFDFKWSDFIDFIQNYIVAMELSHNNGLEDQHMLLKDDGWYWDLIRDARFINVYKILECRNTDIDKIVKNINLIKQNNNIV